MKAEKASFDASTERARSDRNDADVSALTQQLERVDRGHRSKLSAAQRVIAGNAAVMASFAGIKQGYAV